MIPDAGMIEIVGQVLDVAGVAVIAGGILVASGHLLRHRGCRTYRRHVGRAILLGLEFLVAADTIKSVAIAPTFRSVGVLAVIVAVRTFVSVSLQAELPGQSAGRDDG